MGAVYSSLEAAPTFKPRRQFGKIGLSTGSLSCPVAKGVQLVLGWKFSFPGFERGQMRASLLTTLPRSRFGLPVPREALEARSVSEGNSGSCCSLLSFAAWERENPPK